MAQKTKPQTQPLNFSVGLTITEKNNNHALEIRKMTTDTEAIKIILDAAFSGQPIIVFPKFSDKFRAINTLMHRGILDFNEEKGEYYFLI